MEASSIRIVDGEIQKPVQGEFYRAEDIALLYCLTPLDVVLLVRKYHNLLHVYNVNDSDRDFLYSASDPMKTIDILNNMRFHYLDLRKYHNSLQTLSDTIVQNEHITAVESQTQVNAARWEASCQAACAVLVAFMEAQETKAPIKKAEFFAMLAKHYRGKGGVHCKVEKIAWAALPASRKQGAGCPKKNPENG